MIQVVAGDTSEDCCLAYFTKAGAAYDAVGESGWAYVAREWADDLATEGIAPGGRE